MTLERYLWRHHADEMTDLVIAVLTSRFRPLALTEWWAAMAEYRRPIDAMRDGRIDCAALVEMATEANPITRTSWPKKVQIAADALRQAAREARERGAA